MVIHRTSILPEFANPVLGSLACDGRQIGLRVILVDLGDIAAHAAYKTWSASM